MLAVARYDTLLGVPPGDPAAWALPASYAVVAVTGLGWGLVPKFWRPPEDLARVADHGPPIHLPDGPFM